MALDLATLCHPLNPMSLRIADKFRVALLQFHAGADKAANLAKVAQYVQKAVSSTPKPDMLVLPECFQSPYDVTQFRNYAEAIPAGETTVFLSDLAKQNGVTIVGGSIPELDGDKIYNTSLVFDPNGEIIAKHRKVHLFDISIPNGITFKESDSLTAGDKATVFEEKDLGKFGLAICYDIRFPELTTVAARSGAGAMIIPGAFNTVTGPKYWTKFAVSRAIDNQIYVILCSPARNVEGGGYQAYGHSMVVDPNGDVIVEAGHDETIVYADIDKSVIDLVRASIPITTQRRYDIYEDITTLTKFGAI